MEKKIFNLNFLDHLVYSSLSNLLTAEMDSRKLMALLGTVYY